MNEIPLSDASFSEVCARVAYRLIKRRFALVAAFGYDDTTIYHSLVRSLDKKGWKVMSFWVAAYAYAWDKHGEVSDFTRTAFIMRARLGFDFRGVAYAPYKRRSGDPPVSNTGVTSRATKKGGSAL